MRVQVVQPGPGSLPLALSLFSRSSLLMMRSNYQIPSPILSHLEVVQLVYRFRSRLPSGFSPTYSPPGWQGQVVILSFHQNEAKIRVEQLANFSHFNDGYRHALDFLLSLPREVPHGVLEES